MFIHEPLSCAKLKGSFPAGTFFAQAKLQGYRATAFKQPDGRVSVFGRDQRPHLEFLSRFPRLLDTDWYREFSQNAPPMTSVDAEILVPGMPDSAVPTALRTPKSNLEIISFAVPFVDGVNIYGHTLQKTERVFRSFMPSCLFAPYIHVPEGITTPHQARELAQNFIDNGYEGAVIKRANYINWWKIKSADTVDGVITGIMAGNGKYESLVGSIIVSVYSKGKLVEIASAGGMTDQVRLELTKMYLAGDLIGKVAEIEYQEVAGQGRLKHPRFSRLRDDKPPEQCTMDQLNA